MALFHWKNTAYPLLLSAILSPTLQSLATETAIHCKAPLLTWICPKRSAFSVPTCAVPTGPSGRGVFESIVWTATQIGERLAKLESLPRDKPVPTSRHALLGCWLLLRRLWSLYCVVAADDPNPPLRLHKSADRMLQRHIVNTRRSSYIYKGNNVPL